MAAPHVAGAAALIKSYYPNLTVSELKQRLISNNNVSYNVNLTGKVLSNGTLNVWNSFCNDSSIPRRSPSRRIDENNSNIKERIIEAKNNANESMFTNKVFVNIDDAVDKDALINSIVPNADILRVMRLTGSLLIEFETVEEAIAAIEILNNINLVNYAEPVYNIKLMAN